MSPFSQSWKCWAGFTSKSKNSKWGILTKNLWTDELLSNVVHQRWCRLSEKAKWNTSNEMSWHLRFAAISVLGIMRNSNSLLNWEARLKQNTNIKHEGKPWYFIRHPNNPNWSETFPYYKGTAFNKYCPFDFKILDENNRLHSLSHNSSILYFTSKRTNSISKELCFLPMLYHKSRRWWYENQLSYHKLNNFCRSDMQFYESVLWKTLQFLLCYLTCSTVSFSSSKSIWHSLEGTSLTESGTMMSLAPAAKAINICTTKGSKV